MLDPNTKFPVNDNQVQLNGSYTYNDAFKYATSNLQSWNEEEDPFRAKPKEVEEEADSGPSTPPLWSNTGSPPPARLHQGISHLSYRVMSPNSRTQAIARGQQELMEMVSRMPEGCYELSLKDIVEHPVMVEPKQDSSTKVSGREKGASLSGRGGRSVSFQEGKKKKQEMMRRSGSFDSGGLFLKLVFPVPFGPKKGRLRSNSRGRVSSTSGGVVDGRTSPRPLLGEVSTCSNDKGGDGDWWQKGSEEDGHESLGFSSSGKSGSSKSSGSSSRSSSRNSTRNGSISCWSCFLSKKGKRAD